MKKKKALMACVLIAALAANSGCGRTIDTKDDPLSSYSVGSLLPFASRDPSLIDPTTVPPSATPTGVVTTVSQGWQYESVPQVAATATPVPTTIPTAAAYVRLEAGSTGENVVALQNRLIQLGYLTGTADGTYGQQTQNAIRLFQKALGISQTGIANVSLQEKLFSASAPAYSATGSTQNTTTGTVNAASAYSTLVRGDSGTAVLTLQNRLKELGYLTGSADGQFGGQTEAAVKRFQAALGLTQSGVASSSLQENLYAASAPRAQVTTAPTSVPTSKPTAVPSYTTSPYSELSYGMKNSLAVQQMQARLKALGFFGGSATGNYYSQTTEAVKLFQSAVGLPATGTATVETLSYLYASNAPTYSPAAAATNTPTPTVAAGGYTELKLGSRGTEVTNLQKRLIALGWSSGTADGIYGKQTSDAIKLFQAAIGYSQDGVASADLQTILFSAVAPYNITITNPPASATPVNPSQPQQYTLLMAGNTGDDVKRLQTRLKELGFFSGVIGGNYLTKTTEAVKLFETALDRTPTGVATPELQEIIFSEAAPSYSDVNAGYSPLEKQDSGIQVVNLQKRLIELGWLSGKADGDFGSKTEAAVSAFQKAVGLSETGKADATTLALIYAANAPVPTQAPQPTGTPIPAPVVTATPEPYVPAQSSQPSEYQALQSGDSGDAVAAMQRRLKDLGYFTGNVAGNYKELTKAAVQRFQAQMGYPQDGVASSALLELLYSDAAQPYNAALYGYIGLNKGNSGSAVTAMQQRLIELGWLTGKADGDYGKNTENAVSAFQSAVGLNANGTADATTLSYLYAANAPSYVAPVTTQTPTVTQAPVSDNTAGGYVPLAPGDKGDLVKDLQRRLIELGWLGGKADGGYGKNTEKAVLNFQNAAGLIANGIADADTLACLYSASAPRSATPAATDAPTPTKAPSSGYTPLSPGDTGDLVKTMQRRLKELGFFNGDIGGNYLTKTTAAVKAFQAAAGLPQDGVASSAVLELLYSSAAPSANGTPSDPNTPAVPDQLTVLSVGSSGNAVKLLQQRLIDLGWLTGKADGSYGQGTASAVSAFQYQIAQPQDGIANIELQEYLFSDKARPYVEYQELREGDIGQAVLEMQMRLIELGYLDNTEDNTDGEFGPKLTMAIASLQANMGLLSDDIITGIADVEFQTFLFSDNALLYILNR